MAIVVPVIMCGGAGTRLWPASRRARPKQFLRLLSERTLFQEAVLRVHDAELFARALCITNQAYRFVVAEQLREIGIDGDIVLEPVARDSAPALAAACHLASRDDPETLVLAVPADHGIRDAAAFRTCVAGGIAAAREGCIVTFGVKPDHPATAYGYIAPAREQAGDKAMRVQRFVEKPDTVRARKLLAEGCLWNSGNFLMRADVFLNELRRHSPQIEAAAAQAVSGAARDLDFLRLKPEAFARADAVSIDHAVMEKTAKAAVVPADFAWSDIGGWSALWAACHKDGQGNVCDGDVRVVAGRNNYVRSDKPLTVLLGADDLVVVATSDAVMVVPRDKSEMVKALVRDLETASRAEADASPQVLRPWGQFESIDGGERYKVKRITVAPGARLSLQKHRRRAEHWVVVRGEALVTIDDVRKRLHANESAYIPVGAVHRLENPGEAPLEIIEVQCGDYLGEDDIVRIEDDYSRSTAAAGQQAARSSGAQAGYRKGR